MYDNIGKKIKMLAKASFIVEAIAAIVVGLIIWIDTTDWWYALIVFCGPIVAWVSSWLLYGFGELIDKVSDIERNTHGEIDEAPAPSNTEEKAVVFTTSDEIVIKKCEFCGKENVNGAHCKIVDDLGTRFRDLCYDCIEINKDNISIQ